MKTGLLIEILQKFDGDCDVVIPFTMTGAEEAFILQAHDKRVWIFPDDPTITRFIEANGVPEDAEAMDALMMIMAHEEMADSEQ